MEASQPTASMLTIRAVLAAAESMGVNRQELLAAVELDPRLLDDIDAHVPISKLAMMYIQGGFLIEDSAFGLNAAQNIPPGSFGVMEYVVYSSSTLGTAYERICQYWRLMVAGVDVRFLVDEETARFSHQYPPGVTIPRDSQEFVMGCLIVYGRRACGVDWIPTKVTFPHPRPDDIAPHERLFQCAIEFDRPAAEIIFEKSLLESPVVTADPSLLAILDDHVKESLAKIPGRTLSHQVRSFLSSRLPGTPPTLDETARDLGLSMRTLQRRLSEESTSHKDLLRAIRHELAMRYLKERTVAISEVAFLLGFSEPSAFYRAFRRWTGMTPVEYRAS